MTIPRGFRELKLEEKIQRGDLYLCHCGCKEWMDAAEYYGVNYAYDGNRKTIRKTSIKQIKINPAQEKILLDYLSTNRADNADKAIKLKEDSLEEQIAAAMVDKNLIKFVNYGNGPRYYL